MQKGEQQEDLSDWIRIGSIDVNSKFSIYIDIKINIHVKASYINKPGTPYCARKYENAQGMMENFKRTKQSA